MAENKVTLIGYYGGDKTHCLSAWQSTGIEFDYTRSVNSRIDLLFSETVKAKKKTPQELLTMLANEGHHCYDDQTQILTDRGWLFFDQLNSSDAVCAVNISSGNAHFEIPSQIYSSYYNEPMFYVSAQHIDMAVTKGHRMVVSQKRMADGSDYGTKWEFQTPEEIGDKSRKFLLSAQIQNNDLFGEKLARLIGFFVGDGHSKDGHRLYFHLKKQRKIDFLRSIGFAVEEKENNKYVVNIGHFDFLSCYSSEKEKCLPGNILGYSQNDFKNILIGLRNSDGSNRNRGYDEFVFYTTSKILKEQLQTLACLHSIVISESNGIKNPPPQKYCYRLNVSKRIAPEVSTMPSRKLGKYEWKHYSGMVFCVTVTTGAVMVRRNGKPFVSGNTPFEKSALHFQITADLATHIHLLKHRISVSINAESARYKELKDQWYIPDDWQGQDVIWLNSMVDNSEWDGRDAAYSFVGKGEDWATVLNDYVSLGHELYHIAVTQLTPILGRKRAKESARYFLPYAKQLDFDCQFNFRSFMHFQGLRNSDHAQKEVHAIAQSMLEQVRNIPGNPFKYSLEAFGY